MECLKMCCKDHLVKESEPEKRGIQVKMPQGEICREMPRSIGISEDYLLSKMPLDGREVPFVLPTYQPTYIQPRGPGYPHAPPGPQSSARIRYAERKAELSAHQSPGYGSTETSFHPDQKAAFMSPGSARRDTLQQNRIPAPQGPVCELRAGQQRLSSSLMDLSRPLGRMQQRFDSVSSVQSNTSSMMSSMQSSLESIGLSGDEGEPGKVCVRVSYQEKLEQVWIALVQCSDLTLPGVAVDQQRIQFKGIITTSKPVQFKSSVKDYVPDVEFMETFVFALRLQKLHSSALVLRLQTLSPKKRSVAQCVLPLRRLGPQETEHWLELRPASKSPVCHAELHVATCFQAVSSRVQVQVIAAQNLPTYSSPLSQVFFVKVELQRLERPTTTKKTKALKASDGTCQWAETLHFLLPPLDHDSTLAVKLYSRSSVRRKQYLGEVLLGLNSADPAAAEQWRNTLAQPEIHVAAWHRLSRS
ncbi:tandem C2 domains nuclear protein isoform X1 [Gadus morhua]|uniref:tandem C2 domains nuclear protein isoform X1 n=1 Tax=Gadus morhua TaxID=8049 RepID=UPI0011B49E31|nr:tandem C2 domains nuclear protein isoform X1 [Gadus morhua]